MHKQQPLALTILFVTVLALVSCASAPGLKPATPFDYFGFFLPASGQSSDTNDLYALIPVEGNEVLLHEILRPYMPYKTAQDLMVRTQTVYAAFTHSSSSFKIAATGSFPKSFVPLIFSSSNGWYKKSFTSDRVPSRFTSYFEAQTGAKSIVQAAVPYSGLALASSSGMQTMLERAVLQNVPFTVDEKIRLFIENTPETSVCFYAPNPAALISRLTKNAFTLPVASMAGNCVPVYDAKKLVCYELSVYLKISEPRLVRPVSLLLRGLLKNFSAADISVGTDAELVISGLRIEPDTLSLLL